mgnify:CR=1 FL=1
MGDKALCKSNSPLPYTVLVDEKSSTPLSSISLSAVRSKISDKSAALRFENLLLTTAAAPVTFGAAQLVPFNSVPALLPE